MSYLHQVSFVIGVLGVGVIMLGVMGGVVRFIRSELGALRGQRVDTDRRQLRQTLGYYLLLGLEFLIAADIIETLVTPSTEELIVLGTIVAIRTVISCSLNSELAHDAQHPRKDAAS